MLFLKATTSNLVTRTIPSPPPNSTKTSNVPPEDANYTQQPPLRHAWLTGHTFGTRRTITMSKKYETILPIPGEAKAKVIGHRFVFKTENDNVEKKRTAYRRFSLFFSLFA